MKNIYLLDFCHFISILHCVLMLYTYLTYNIFDMENRYTGYTVNYIICAAMLHCTRAIN